MRTMLLVVTRKTNRILGQFLIVLAVASLDGCTLPFSDRCDDQIQTHADSPKGKYEATVFVRNCGATTDYSSIINLRETSSRFNADADDNTIFVVKGRPRIGIEWITTDHVRVSCSACSQENIFKQVQSWKDVKVSY